jgi:hypothetical protein
MLAVIVSPRSLPSDRQRLVFCVSHFTGRNVWLAHENIDLSGIYHDHGVKLTKPLSWQLLEAAGVEK